jgi:hypothetical protein
MPGKKGAMMSPNGYRFCRVIRELQCGRGEGVAVRWWRLGNTQYSALRQINTKSVKDLGAAWVVKLNAAGPTSAIVVANGRMFVESVLAGTGLDSEDEER